MRAYRASQTFFSHRSEDPNSNANCNGFEEKKKRGMEGEEKLTS